MVNKKICSYLNRRLVSIGVIPLLLGVLIITPSAYTQDTTPPQIMDVRDFPDPVEVGANINIDCTVIDNIAVASVSVLIYSPIDPPTNYSMTKIPSTANGYYFSQQFNDPGTYSYAIWARDPTGNTNHSSEYFFTVEDLVPPEVNLIYPNGGEIVNGTVTIQWTATDD